MAKQGKTVMSGANRKLGGMNGKELSIGESYVLEPAGERLTYISSGDLLRELVPMSVDEIRAALEKQVKEVPWAPHSPRR